MAFELSHLFFVGIIYLMVLFLIAYATDQGWLGDKLARHPLTYALSLGVYATSWTFYGSVGFAQSNGYNFLSIYLGVTLAFVLAPILFAPVLRIVRDYQLTSLADLFAFRYQSQLAGVLVTLFMLAGVFPYIALQILAVTESASILTNEATPRVLALAYCITLTVFAILFAARHVTPRDKHDGLVVAIAFESLVKLIALCTIGLFALYHVFGGLGGLGEWLEMNPAALQALYQPVRDGPWTTLMLLSFCAAFLLPRQFHMMFTENLNERAVFTSTWAVPLFLLLLNLFIPVILWAGQELATPTSPDFYVLGITLVSEKRLLPYLAFIGGLSAASAMMIVTTVSLASMCLNHLLLPATRYPDPDINLYRWLLWGRRTLIVVIITAGYGFYVLLEHNQGLVKLGLISFVAVAQFLPGFLGTLFWPRATAAGFIAGLVGGAVVWGVTLLLPLLSDSGLIGAWAWLEWLLDHPGLDHWTFATLCSLALNGALFVSVSLLAMPTQNEAEAAQACRATSFSLPGGLVLGAQSAQQFEQQLSTLLGAGPAHLEVQQALRDLGLDSNATDPGELRRLRERIQRNLSGLLGPMLARMIVDERLQTDPNARIALTDNIRLIEERLERSRERFDGVAAELDQLRRYHQRIIEELPLAACAVDTNRKIVSWNRAMQTLSGVSRSDAQGRVLRDLPAPIGALLDGSMTSPQAHRHKIHVDIAGEGRWFNLHKALIDDGRAGESARGAVLLVEDLSEVHQLEGELAHAERLASIGRLAAGIAHEIGNPVTGIACLAQNLQSETLEPAAQQASQDILGLTQRISNIMQSLVNFSHGGSVTGTHVAAVNICECVDEAINLVKLSRAARQCQIVNATDSALCTDGDRPRLVQVLVNVLTNAIDAGDDAATVTVEASARGGNAHIRVIDSGRGIPNEVAGRVFEPFVTTKAPGAGTGLGLSLAYRIVLDHGGTIEIERSGQLGTTMLIRLPLTRSTVDQNAALSARRS